MEDSKKVAARVRRYRERTSTERLEIIGVPSELKEQFRTLPGLESAKAADRLQALVDLWLQQNGKASEKPSRDSAPASPILNQERRQDIDRWFSESWTITLPLDRARSRYWQQQLKENQELRDAVSELGRRLHPQFAQTLKKNRLPILPSQILALASMPPDQALELFHAALFKSKDPIDALEAELGKFRTRNR